MGRYLDIAKKVEAQAETPITSKEENQPSLWARLADSGLHHNDVADLAQVVFLFGCEQIADPDRGQFPGDLPRTWGHYAPFWRERLPHEAFAELERRYRCQADLRPEREAGPPQGPKPLRPLVLNPEGTGCAACGSADYWVSGMGARFCLDCCPVFFKNAIAIGRLERQEEARRPSMRRRAGGGRA